MSKSDPLSRQEARRLLSSARAVIFDFDGLLVDTEYAIYESWKRVFLRYGHELPLSVYNQCLGSGPGHWNPADYLESLTGLCFDWHPIHTHRQNEISRDLENEGLLPGAKELMQSLHVRNIPMAVASSSSHRWIDSWLEKLSIRSFFKAVVCRDDDLPVKPDPALFLRASELLNIAPEDCLVFEDSRNGTTAALRAGMPVITIPNRITEHADLSHAPLILGSFCELC